MSHALSIATAEELDKLERELTISREEIADLNRRAHVIEIETGSWRPARSLQPAARARGRGAPLGFLVGLLLSSFVTGLITMLAGR
jgi:hypothetical protein